MDFFGSVSDLQSQFQTFAQDSQDTLTGTKTLVGQAQSTFDGNYFQPVTYQPTSNGPSSPTSAPTISNSTSQPQTKVGASNMGFMSKVAAKFKVPVWSVAVAVAGVGALVVFAMFRAVRGK